MPAKHTHTFAALGVACERTEKPRGNGLDKCYAMRLSGFDSDDDEGESWLPLEVHHPVDNTSHSIASIRCLEEK